MSLIDRLPTRRPRQAPQHRAIDKVERLEALLAGARMLIKGLRLQLDDQAREHADAVARIDARNAETVRGLEQQIASLERRLNIGVRAEHVVTKTQESPVAQVLALWEARDSGRLGPVTDPGHATTP